MTTSKHIRCGDVVRFLQEMRAKRDMAILRERHFGAKPLWGQMLEGDMAALGGRRWHRDVTISNVGTRLDDCRPYRADRDRAYREGLDEFVAYAEHARIGEHNWLVHPNVNLYVDVSGHCNGNCGFCIAKTTYERPEIAPDKFADCFSRALELTQHMNPSVQIVGGEPTIYPGIGLVLDVIDAHTPKRPVLGTNATGLDSRLAGRLNDSRIEHINVSRHHYDDARNQAIMRLRPAFPNTSLWRNLAGIGGSIDIRMQCNLIAGFIDSYADVCRFIEWARAHGIRNLVFSQLTPLPAGDIYRRSIIDYVAARQVDINGILAAVEASPDFVFEKYRGGVACYYEVWLYKGDTTVLFKCSDNKYLVEADRMPRHIPDLILHSDGTLCGSWNRALKVIAQGGQS